MFKPPSPKGVRTLPLHFCCMAWADFWDFCLLISLIAAAIQFDLLQAEVVPNFQISRQFVDFWATEAADEPE